MKAYIPYKVLSHDMILHIKKLEGKKFCPCQNCMIKKINYLTLWSKVKITVALFLYITLHQVLKYIHTKY